MTAAKVPEDEPILYQSHPAMFRNKPVLFVLLLAVALAGLTVVPWLLRDQGTIVMLIAAAVGVCLGLIPLLMWYVKTRSTEIVLTNEQTTLRKGIFSKHTNDVFHENVRNIHVRQSLFQRMMGVGDVGISSAGQAGIEIEVDGVPDPERIKQIIDDSRG